ncbi:MAG: hypothetical protein IJ811_01575 [Clostridia bacterium]|nr:hypothetical protein [Clostridia bacterium]
MKAVTTLRKVGKIIGIVLIVLCALLTLASLFGGSDATGGIGGIPMLILVIVALILGEAGFKKVYAGESGAKSGAIMMIVAGAIGNTFYLIAGIVAIIMLSKNNGNDQVSGDRYEDQRGYDRNDRDYENRDYKRDYDRPSSRYDDEESEYKRPTARRYEDEDPDSRARYQDDQFGGGSGSKYDDLN